jgi:hypothetical protein
MLIDETRSLIERDRHTLRRLTAALAGTSIRVRHATRLVAESQELLDRIERRSSGGCGRARRETLDRVSANGSPDPT